MVFKIGAVYGNLRIENLLIKMSKDQTKIKAVKFLHFGHLVRLEEVENIFIPECIEHLPPDLISHLLRCKKFCDGSHHHHHKQSKIIQQRCYDSKSQLLQSAATADVFSLGIILLQMFSGYPCQLENPLHFKCETIHHRYFMGTPHFGFQKGKLNEEHVSMIIRLQERHLNNLDKIKK